MAIIMSSDPSEMEEFELSVAAWNGRIDVCKVLIEERKFPIDFEGTRGENPLMRAVETGRVETAEYLIAQGANVSHSDWEGMTALHYAAENGNEELMDLLLSKGSDIEAKSVKGTPLQLAASCANLSSVRFLLSRGAKPNSVSPLAASPIVSAIINDSPDCFEMLLKDKVDPNASSFGKSPLAHAASEGRERFIEPLLMAGAKPNSIGTALMKPIEFAAFSGNREIVKVLFPLTSRVPVLSDWSLSGVLKSIDSGEAKEKIQQKKDRYIELAFERGIQALNRKDYSDAILWFSEAIFTDPTDYYAWSNRSLCWANLNQGMFALHDAQACIRLKPDLAEAHKRQSEAWRLLKKYPFAVKALGKAWDSAPRDKDKKKKYMEAVFSGFREMAKNHQVETVKAALQMLTRGCWLFDMNSRNKEIQKELLEDVFSKFMVPNSPTQTVKGVTDGLHAKLSL